MSVIEKAKNLMEEHGFALLSNPLRMEAFLKDLCPEEERDIFLLTEAHFAGFVDIIRKQNRIPEGKRQELAMELVRNCGLTIVNACWAIDAWVDILPQWAFENEKLQRFDGTLDEVLGSLQLKNPQREGEEWK